MTTGHSAGRPGPAPRTAGPHTTGPHTTGPRTTGNHGAGKHDAGTAAGAVAVRDERAARGPRADCTVTRSGDLVVHVALPDATAPRLLLRRRGDDLEVRLPLEPAGTGSDGGLRAVLPAGTRLAEGRWDVHAVPDPEGRPLRLVPGLNDLRTLVDQERDPGASPVAVRIPYATKHGNLSVRAWLRPAHAEVGDLLVTDSGFAANARLLGAAELSADAVVEARCRRAPGRVREVPARGTGEEGCFTFAVPYRDLAGDRVDGQDFWDLWLRTGPGAEPVRLGRLLDDLADRRNIFTYPARTLRTPYGGARVRPCFTGDNDLSVTVSEAP